MEEKKYNRIFVLTLLLTLMLSALAPYAKAEEFNMYLSNLSQAEDYAKKLIEKEYPFAKDSVVLDVQQEFVLGKITNYAFYFKRMIDGIPYPDNFIFYSFDQTGKMIGQNINWNKQIQLPEQSATMKVEDAKAKFTEHMEPLIFYQDPNTANSFYKYDLHRDTLIDAVTGEWFVAKSKDESTEDELIAEKSLVSSVRPINTEKEALERASSLALLGKDVQPPTVSILPYSVFNSRIKGPFWNISWSKNKRNTTTGSCYLTVQFQQSTGQLVSYFNQCAIEEQKPVSKEEARQKAIQIIKQYTPQIAHQLMIEDIYIAQATLAERDGTQSYVVKFVRRIPGVSSTGSALVSIDKQSGMLSDFTSNLDDLNYEAIPKVDKTKLNRMLIDKYDLQLSYEAVSDMKNIAKAEKESSTGFINEDPSKVRLVYRLIPKEKYNNYFIDAENAVWRSVITGKEATKESIELEQSQ
jgi:hypothetical protein